MDKKKVTEANIRDYISANLDLIEPRLILVDTEFYLPNKMGSVGFLDIFARDAAGKLVIIEIKRTNAAAREAIQELYKYVPLLREKFLVKNTEVRLILLSVEWRELSTPYAEFASSAPFEVTAGAIILDTDGTPVAIEPVKPNLITNERKIGVRHFLWGFPDKVAASKAVPVIARRLQRFGLADFVIIQSRATNPNLCGRSFLYFAQRELRFEEYMKLIEASFEEVELNDFNDRIADLTELEDRVAEASDAMWELHGGVPGRMEIGSDSVEISYPEKGNIWFKDGAQEDIIIHRFGRFVDPWLDDYTIIDEIRGDGGESDFRLRFATYTDSPPQMAALRQRVENIFFFNETWLGSVMQLIRYAERKSSPARVELIAYSPEDILRALAASAFGFVGYLPTFKLVIEHDGDVEQFIGLPEWNGSTPNFGKVIAEHFSGDGFGYFIACHFGENRSMNHDIMADLGLRYGVFREGKSGLERLRVQGSSIIQVKGDIRSINHIIDNYQEEVGNIVNIFMSKDQGFSNTIKKFIDDAYDMAELRLAKILEGEVKPKKEIYWCGDVENCDLFFHSFSLMRFMVDAILPGGFGANICAVCFLQKGRGIGIGLGQVYEASTKGWRYIAG
ncbi:MULTISPECIES: endonuclease NucS domain-containing protein [unclassified Gluconobacter]|uniref:endonuclease NucS domain-containing protein n=1 Tax=unclassified Gluconobacter TaxID=2644261 RepID=UPI001C05BFC9|nr:MULTISPECIES: endonuclease NucS domain-containing protein [unclassified Gluconobacter]